MACTTGCGSTHPCSKCKVEFPCESYYRRRSRGTGERDRRGERVYRCKGCQSETRAKYRRNGEQNDYMRLWRYGLTADQFSEALSAQGGRCAICRTSEPGGKGTWCIDHDHKCCPGVKSCGSCIRGLLCTKCNTGIGLFGDDPNVMRKAAEYVGG